MGERGGKEQQPDGSWAGLFFLMKRERPREPDSTTFAPMRSVDSAGSRGRRVKEGGGPPVPNDRSPDLVLVPEETKAAWGFRPQPYTHTHTHTPRTILNGGIVPLTSNRSLDGALVCNDPGEARHFRPGGQCPLTAPIYGDTLIKARP